jgi:hypothetical protein
MEVEARNGRVKARPTRTLAAGVIAVAAVLLAATVAIVASGSREPAAAASGWKAEATVGSATVAPGATLSVSISVTSTLTRLALVDLEIYRPGIARVYQTFWNAQTFRAGRTTVIQTTWAVPTDEALDTHVVKIGLFSPGWGRLYAWNDNAATFTVSADGSDGGGVDTTTSTTTTTESPPITPAPTTTTTTESPSTTSGPPTTPAGHDQGDCMWSMDTPIGALPPAMPMLCDSLITGPSTFVQGPNSWLDDFNHHLSMATIGDGYKVFEKQEGVAATGTFRHNEHWMVDVGVSNDSQVGGSLMRPDRSFRFENGKLVIESDVAASVESYKGFAWPELTVTTSSSPVDQPYGPTPGRSSGDGLYAYGQFGGYDTIGIRLQGPRPILAYYDSTERGFPSGRVFELSWFQDGSGQNGSEKQFEVWGGGEWMNPDPPAIGFRTCNGTDPDINCRDRFRWELTKTSLTLYVNGVKYMEHTALPGHGLPDAIVNGNVYVYFDSWVYQPPAGSVTRFHWDHLAVNP